jgi:hypothetical protein
MQMKQSRIVLSLIITFIVAGAGGYYIGKHVTTGTSDTTTSSDNQARQGQSATRTGMGGMRRNGQGGGFLGGSVISKDSTSLTMSIPNGGSKIIFYSPTTAIQKTATGTPEDITAGSMVSVSGTQNPDGSMSANAITIRPSLSPRPQ